MKIAVFGGGGFIGSAICDRLLQDMHQLRVFERPRIEPYRVFNTGEEVEWITGDLMSLNDVTNAVEGVDVVLHLVSTTLPKSSNDDPIYDAQSNLVATLQLLQAMVHKCVPRVVFISSGGTIYGNPKYLPIDEEHPTEPRVSYGVTKLAIEKYLLMYQEVYGIKVSILRVANPYGERQRIETAQGAVGVFLSKAIRNQPIEIWGDGEIIRDYLYVGDVADAFARAVSYNGAKSIFNISSGNGVSLNELIKCIENVLNREVIRDYKPRRAFDVPVSVLDNSLILQEMGWKPEVSLHEGISRSAAWIRASLEK